MVTGRADGLNVFMIFLGVSKVVVIFMPGAAREPPVPTIKARHIVWVRQKSHLDKVVYSPPRLFFVSLSCGDK